MNENKNPSIDVANKKDNNNLFKLVVVILVLLFLILSCYIVYSEFILDASNNNETHDRNEDYNNSVEEQPKEPVEVPDVPEEPEEVPISEELALQLYRILFIPSELQDEFLEYYKHDLIKVDNLSNAEKNRLVIINFDYKNDPVDYYHGYWPKVTREKIIEIKNRVLGESVTFDIINSNDEFFRCFTFHQDIDGNFVAYFCDEPPMIPTTLVVGEFSRKIQKGEYIYLDQMVVFPDYFDVDSYDNMSANFYQDPERTVLLGNKNYTGNGAVTLGIGVIDMSDFAEQARVYRFTFRQNGDYYSFVQMERIK